MYALLESVTGSLAARNTTAVQTPGIVMAAEEMRRIHDNHASRFAGGIKAVNGRVFLRQNLSLLIDHNTADRVIEHAKPKIGDDAVAK